MKKHFILVATLFGLLTVACDPTIVDPPPIDTTETLACNFTEDTILEDITDGVDYIVDCHVSVEAVLTIQPGVIIEFRTDAAMTIEDDGAIVAEGTSDSPIVFRGESATKGYWQGIAIRSSDVRNSFDHVRISDAGSAAVEEIWFSEKAGVALISTTIEGKLAIKNSSITNCDGYGLAAQDDTTISDFGNNAIENNSLAAVYVGANNAKMIDNESVFLNNGFDGVELFQSTLTNAGGHTWAAVDYNISGDYIDVEEDLTIEAGARLFFDPSSMMEIGADGTLIAEGTITNPIVFTGSVTSVPSWKGIIIRSSSVENVLRNCEVSYGGSDPGDEIWAGDAKANILVIETTIDGRLRVEDCLLTNSGGCGIFADENTSLTQSGNTFTDITLEDICN